MKTSDIRAAVLAKRPQARYLNLSDTVGPCHCIDDDVNGKYIAYGAPSRRAAWYRALKSFSSQADTEGKQ